MLYVVLSRSCDWLEAVIGTIGLFFVLFGKMPRTVYNRERYETCSLMQVEFENKASELASHKLELSWSFYQASVRERAGPMKVDEPEMDGTDMGDSS